MELKGIRVRHKAFGEGVVQAQRGEYIFVDFSDGERQFTFPDAYGAFLFAVDPAEDAAVLAHIEALRAKKSAKSSAEKKEKFMRRLKEMQEKKN